MNKFSKSILEKIKTEHLKPKARWQFVLKNIVLWSLAIVAVVAAGVFIASFIQDLLEAEWDIAHRYPGGQFHFLRQAISTTWLIAIAAVIALAFVFFRKTKRGYRYGVFVLAGIIFTSSVVLGTSLVPTKIPEKVRDFKAQKFGRNFDEQRWQNPQEGFLLGDIIEIEGQIFILSALDKKVWKVDALGSKMPPDFDLKQGDRVRVIGEKSGEDTFRADFVKPEKPSRFLRRDKALRRNSKIQIPKSK